MEDEKNCSYCGAKVEIEVVAFDCWFCTEECRDAWETRYEDRYPCSLIAQ